MKRSKMIEVICDAYNNVKCGDEIMTEFLANNILESIEESGMLPPTQECKLVPDELRGGIKHGPALRVWDEE